jgi:hypothetical protein
MAAQTQGVSGVAAIRLILAAATTQLFLTGGVDGQILVLILQQDATGGRLVTSGNIPGIGSLDSAALSDTIYLLIYDASTNAWTISSTTFGNAAISTPQIVYSDNAALGFAVFNAAAAVTAVPAGAPAGVYQISLYLVTTTTFVTNTEETITFGWTDAQGNRTVVYTTSALTAGTTLVGSQLIESTGVNAITWTPNVTGSAATAGAANVSIVVQRVA